MEFKKLGVFHLTKTYFISVVSEECFNNSNKIESVGLFDVFKIFNDEDLNFRVAELKRLNYSEDLK